MFTEEIIWVDVRDMVLFDVGSRCWSLLLDQYTGKFQYFARRPKIFCSLFSIWIFTGISFSYPELVSIKY